MYEVEGHENRVKVNSSTHRKRAVGGKTDISGLHKDKLASTV